MDEYVSTEYHKTPLPPSKQGFKTKLIARHGTIGFIRVWWGALYVPHKKLVSLNEKSQFDAILLTYIYIYRWWWILFQWPRALSYYKDLTLSANGSAAFNITLPVAKILATVSCRSSETEPIRMTLIKCRAEVTKYHVNDSYQICLTAILFSVLKCVIK